MDRRYLPAPDRATRIGAVLRAADGARRARERWLRRLADDALDARERRELRRALVEAEATVIAAAGCA